MDRRFFKSKEFKVGIIVFLLVLAGGVAAVASGATVSANGCLVRLPAGGPAAASSFDEGATARTRTTTFAFPAGGGNVTVRACTDVGSIDIGPSVDEEVHVSAVVRAQYGFPDGSEDRIVRVHMAPGPERSELSVWVDGSEEAAVPWWFGGPAFEVDIDIRLPDNGTHKVDLSTDVGNIGLHDLRLHGIEARTDVGNVRGEGLRASGEIKVLTDVGDVGLRFDPAGDAEMRVSSDVGNVDLEFVEGDATGYWVTVSSDVADIAVRLGDMERYQRDMRGAGGSVEARTEGYDQAAMQWRVRVSTDVGDVSVDKR
ncbi:MAG: DUF4097 domain-containing protein [Euryarchaeota archaeon]|nr:DUF4097 domain-containing protein [Euryarchaeota archaeon]